MSSNETPFQKLGLSCLQGSFYICAGYDVEFLGCCGVDPCNDTLNGACPQAELGNATYSTDSHYEIPAEACEDTTSTTKWYTCSFDDEGPFGGTRPFMGCCANNQNPCSDGGCSTDNMRIAVLSKNETERAIFTENLPGYSNGTSATATPVASTEGKSGLSTGAIVGIAVGAAAVVVIIVGIIMFRLGICFRKKMVEEKQGGHGPVPQGDDEMGGFGHPMSPPVKPAAYRESYMTATTAYSPVPHGTPDTAFPKPMGSPSAAGDFESPDGFQSQQQRYSDQSSSVANSRHISSMSGYSGHTFNTPAPYGSAAWSTPPAAGDGLGVQMQTVAELPDQQIDRPVSELPPETARKHVSELPAGSEDR